MNLSFRSGDLADRSRKVGLDMQLGRSTGVCVNRRGALNTTSVGCVAVSDPTSATRSQYVAPEAAQEVT